ncbi:MAG: ABC transporter permease, partial [Chloroflexota bacterium]
LQINTRLFFQGAYLSYLALFSWLRPAVYMASKVIMPLAQMMFFVVLGTYATGIESAPFYVVGNAMQITALSGIYGVTLSIGGDRWAGTLPYLFGTPANRLTMFLGRAVVHIIDGMLGVFLGFLWGVLIFDLNLTEANPLLLILTILITTISTAGMGLVFGCISLVSVNIMFLNNTVYFLLLLFAGVNVEISKLPVYLQPISNILPLTRGIKSARLIVDGAKFADVSPLLLQELGMGVIYITVGYILFRRFEIQAKIKGTLDSV